MTIKSIIVVSAGAALAVAMAHVSLIASRLFIVVNVATEDGSVRATRLGAGENAVRIFSLDPSKSGIDVVELGMGLGNLTSQIRALALRDKGSLYYATRLQVCDKMVRIQSLDPRKRQAAIHAASVGGIAE